MPRRYLQQEGRALRDEYELRKWFKSDPEIRERYFGEIEHTMETLRTEDGDPPDRTVVEMLAHMCEKDGSLNSHVAEKHTNPTPWKELREVGAAVAFEAYVREVEEQTWP